MEPLSWAAILRLLLEGAVEWIKWQVLESQIRIKTLLIDRKEQYEDEATELQTKIDDLRLAGRNDLADVLYNQLLRRTEYTTDLSAELLVAQEGNIGADPQGPVPPPGG